MLIRYWIKFDRNKLKERGHSKLALGIGVTAYSLRDAIKIIGSELYIDDDLEKLIVDVNENINVNKISDNHVIGHMGLPSNRGVWFPALNRDGHMPSV